MIVLTEYFPFANTARRAEVLQSIKDNCNVECVERIILFAEEIPEPDREVLVQF